jgi:hypothetical protein
VGHGKFGNPPTKRKDISITHTPIAIAIMTVFLFQMAMLVTNMSAHLSHNAISRCASVDIHAKYDQERSGGNGQVGERLRIKEI